MIGRPGWQIGEAIAVLTEKEGRKVFQAKGDTIEATDLRCAELARFEKDVAEVLERTRYKIQ